MHVAGKPLDNSLRAILMRPTAPALLFLVALVVLMGAGVLFRSWGVVIGTLDFWADEAWWAINVIEQPLLEPSIRPMGYMWLSALLTQLGSPELVLRLPSYLAGIGFLACICASSMMLFRSRIVILFVVLLAVLHPTLIVYAKEFKPYSLEAFIHSGLLLWALVCFRRSRTGTGFWVAVGVALPFCYNIVFLCPALVLALAPQLLDRVALPSMGHYVARNLDRRLLAALAVVVCLACLAMSALFENERKLFWGAKYGVFPIELGVAETLLWYVKKTWMLVTQPAALRALDPAIQSLLRPILFGAYLLGIWNLLHRRRLAELCLLVSPLGFVVLANVLGYWPYGDFRTNLFLIPYSLLVMGFGLDSLIGHVRARSMAWAAMLLISLGCLPVDVEHFRWKWMRDGAPAPQLTQVLDDVLKRRELDGGFARNVIIADWHSWRTLDYYLRYHPEARARYASLSSSTDLIRGPLNGLPLLENLLREEHRLALEQRRSSRAWVVVTKLNEFRGLRSMPLVRQFEVYSNEFATQDKAYHPELIELRFEWPPAAPGGADAG